MKFDPALFGTAEHPLRPSALNWVVRCPVYAVLQFLEAEDSSGPAAQTGSLVHEAVAAFHLEPDASKKIAAAVSTLQSAAKKFPLAESNEARLYLEPYVSDPRNANAEILAVERKVTLTLDPHPLDPTGNPVVIRGTLDQIRRVNGVTVVDDLKTGRTEGWAMIHDYAYQQAAYCLAARESGFPDAQPGRLIRCYGYRTRTAKLPSPDGVFWQLPFSVAQARALLDRVRLQVALVRRGEVDFGPGPQCSYCVYKGLDGCQPKAERKLFGLPLLGAVAV